MSQDPRVVSAIAHWAPRFVSNGVLLADFQEVTAGIGRWEDWCAAWCRRAALHEGLGHEALEQGWRLSAGEHLSRAAVYYHFAKFVFVVDVEQMQAAHRKAVACKQLAAPLLRPPARRVEIPYQDGTLAGLLRLPPGATRAPLVIMVPGLDSAKEEMEAYELPYLARGMATLLVDGPGQGEAEYRWPIRGDYEVPVKAMVDWAERQPQVDPERIALWGVSLGGYYAPRAAAFEKRLKACIGLAGPYDFAANWEQLPELTRETFRVRSHLATEAQAREHARTLTLDGGIAASIECPLFLVTGKLDRLIPWEDTQRLAREASGPVELLVVEDGNHIANNRPYRWRSRTADWMAQQLGLPQA
ncbi:MULTISPECIES: alpha/beta hydrolase family protein [Ramlibacter]|uniref:Alpha/beta fold hydrolase n=1 Tax=Ramlibacter pinisoli TaxID=2682844 RepID=A0A6N8IRP4_9BURK|nr:MULTISPECIES: alpha/beta fold hydrolase [Ramlibacter]MBA2964436.1 alpha/beta fold hydrolase [Ramlibacter sp. CGMCC 1.13660]MVQ29402.1 alpha/beta fold hydrolase [Ramlibacter pinisoli]